MCANHVSHAGLPYPIKNARFTVFVPYLDAVGGPLDPTTPDTEFTLDASAFADTAEEVTVITGGRGVGYLTLTGAETNGSALALWGGVASGPKATLMTLYPRVLPVLEAGTAQAGAAGTITLAAGAAAYPLRGSIVQTTGGTGGGGAGGLANQARVITAYNTSTKVATVVPNWETTPDATTTYNILMTDMAVNALLGRYLRPTVDERTLDVTATGAAGIDWSNVENPTTAVGLTGTTVDLVANAVDATAIAHGAIDMEAFATGAIDAAAPDLTAALANLTATVDTIAGLLDTEVAAIKAKTDLLPGSPAAVGSVMTLGTDAISAATLALAACEKLADVLCRRHTSVIETSGVGETLTINSLYGALALGAGHKRDTTTHSGMLTVYQADGTTELAQIPITADANADPLVSVGS